MENGALLEGGALLNSSTREAELRTSKQLLKGSYFGSLFFLSVGCFIVFVAMGDI